MTSASWTLLDSRISQTLDRVATLEHDGARRHSFVEYTPEPTSPVTLVDGEHKLMMSGYSYLGLNGDPRIDEAAHRAIELYGTGGQGVRALAGTLPIHRELEEAVARVARRPAAMVFSSGYAANLGVIGGLVGPGDAVFVDKYDHASIVDGCQLSGATVTRFRHNDPDHLDTRLSADTTEGVRLVIVDSVYSMDGDIAPLVELRQVCDRHGALLMVDEAHALGVIGSRGFGIEDHVDWQVEVDIKLGTLSKAIPSVGGWVAGSPDLIGHLRYRARPFVFSAALPAGQAAAAREAIGILEAEPERVIHIQKQAERLRGTLHRAGLDTRSSETAVVPVIAGTDDQAYAYAQTCLENGGVGLPVVSPAVPNGASRLRIALTAAHSEDDVEEVARILIESARSLSLTTG